MVKNTHFLILTEKHWINASKILFIYFYQIIWSKLSNEKKKYKNKKNCLEIINFNIFFIIGLKIDCNSNWVSGQNFPPRSMKFFYKKLELFFYKILFSELIYDKSKSNGNVFFRVIWCETPCRGVLAHLKMNGREKIKKKVKKWKKWKNEKKKKKKRKK